MRKRVVIAGGSGLIGSAFSELLIEKGYEPVILTRNPSPDARVKEYRWDPQSGFVDADALKDCAAVVNLAGANISAKRWTKARKKELIESRIQSTSALVLNINRSTDKPDVFISASASGFYGSRGEMLLDENVNNGQGFMAELCEQWEQAAQAAECRKVVVRIGIILSAEGGFLKEVAAPVKWGIGAVLGSGNQYIPWMHIDDLCRAFLHLVENKNCEGVFNVCGPHAETNRTITKQIAAALHRPLILPAVPEFFLRIVFGELTDALLMSSRCSPTRLQQSGFEFRFTNSGEAIEDLLS